VLRLGHQARTIAPGGRPRLSYLRQNTRLPSFALLLPRSQQRQVKASSREPSRFARSNLNLEALVDETGLPVFYTSGRNYDHGAGARITFPDQRWLRFPVRGTGQADAIMTAVDQAGDEIAWYRLTGRLRAFLAHAMEIAVRPGQPLTDELVLALVISAPWLSSYFDVPSQGGG
jgi:hypothetical protein